MANTAFKPAFNSDQKQMFFTANKVIMPRHHTIKVILFFSRLSLLLITTPMTSRAQNTIDDWVDPYDRLYIEIKPTADQNQSIILNELDSTDLNAVDTSNVSDLLHHWHLSETMITGSYQILNRSTEEALSSNTASTVHCVAPNQNSAQQRWIFESNPNGFVIRNEADSELALSLTNGNLGLNAYDPNLPAQQFTLEAIPQGAAVPWIRYDETNYSDLTNSTNSPLTTVYDSTYDARRYTQVETEAAGLGVILLDDFGSQVSWTVQREANAITMRYALIDKTAGTLTLTLLRSSSSPETILVPVNTNQAWVYFEGGEEHDDDPNNDRMPAKRFAEARILLDTPLQPGDTFTVSREYRVSSPDPIAWIDLIELEFADPYIPQTPTDYISVKDYGAVGDGITQDRVAFVNCMNAALASGKKVYIPEGRYRMGAELVLPEGVTLQGAGMWFSEIYFSEFGDDPGQDNSYAKGGIKGDGSNIILRDVFVTGSQETRPGGYKGIKGYWGTGSLIENIWVEETETGVWIADFTSRNGITDGLIIRNSRFRNTFADGINYSSGTRNSVIENCHFRSTGDDAMASWAAGQTSGKGPTQNQVFRYNTAECVYRAGGIGIFGGGAHKIHNNVILDQYTGAGIRLNSVFVFLGGSQIGYPFLSAAQAEPIRIYSNTLIRTGSRGLFGSTIGAIDIQTQASHVENIEIWDITIEETQFNAIRFNGLSASQVLDPNPQFQDIMLRNVRIIDAPIGTVASGLASGTATYQSVLIQNTQVEFQLNSTFNLNLIQNTAPIIQLQCPSYATIPANHGVVLKATVSDDGSPDGALLSTNWSVLDKPLQADVSLSSIGTAESLASFSLPGRYVLSLTANDSDLQSSKSVTLDYNIAADPLQYFASADIGNPGAAGSVDIQSGIATIQGSGDDIWNNADNFHYMYIPIEGDGSLTARIVNKTNTHEWAKSGIMLRDALDSNSLNSFIATSAERGIAFQNRLSTGGLTQDQPTDPSNATMPNPNYTFPVWLRLTRSGNVVTTYFSTDGSNWTTRGTETIPMTGQDYIGIAVTSHNTGVISTATVDNISTTFQLPDTPTIAQHDIPLVLLTSGSTLAPLVSYNEQSNPAGLTYFWEPITGSDATISTPNSRQTALNSSTEGEHPVRLYVDNGQIRVFREFSPLFVDQMIGNAILTKWAFETFSTTASSEAALYADPDLDNRPNLLEYALKTNPLYNEETHLPLSGVALFQNQQNQSVLEFNYRRRLGIGSGDSINGYDIDGLRYKIETSSTLLPDSWMSAIGQIEEIGSPTPNGDGTETVTLRFNQPATSSPQFIRLKVEPITP